MSGRPINPSKLETLVRRMTKGLVKIDVKYGAGKESLAQTREIIKNIARMEYGREIVGRLESYQKMHGKKMGELAKAIVLMKVVGKLQKMPTNMQKAAMDKIINRFVAEAVSELNRRG